MPFCGLCGAQTASDGFCHHCGATADDPDRELRRTASPPTHARSLWEQQTFARPAEVDRAPPEAYVGTRYARLEELGGGTYGQVWRTWDFKFERMVALKLLRIASEDVIRDFVREAKTVVRLRHPRIAEVFDAGDHQDQYFIAMQLIRGTKLEAYVGGDHVLSAELVCDAAEGVHFAHQEGFVHRDLKPANIMVEQGHHGLGVYVVDFGVARWLADPDHTNKVHGTLCYMAPEQASGEVVDPRTDVFALGATLYHLVTGRPPLLVPRNESTLRSLQRVIEEHPPRPAALAPGVAPELEHLILRCLAKDPRDRFATAADLRAELAHWIEARRRPAQPPRDDTVPATAVAVEREARYTLIDRLGQGGFSEIWRARDNRLGCDVAVKLEREIGDRSHLERMRQRAIEIHAPFFHPIIVPITDSGELDGYPITVMPLIRGVSMERAAISLLEKVRLVREVANAAHVLHRRGYYRLDIKPENLLVVGHDDQPPTVTWLDLDLALHRDDPVVDGGMAGTPIVMAPEQFDGARGDARIDVYALGATLYVLAAGRPAIVAPDLSTFISAVLAGQHTPLLEVAPDSPPALERIVTRAMARRPEDRYQTAADVAHALTAFLSTAGG